MTLWQVSTKKLMTKLTNKIIASLYEKAHKLKLQKNPAKSNQDGLETSTHKKRERSTSRRMEERPT